MQLEFPNIQITSQNRDSLTNILSGLSLERQILFAASICERTLPIYVSIDFPENFNHKTLPILRKILDNIWNYCTEVDLNREKLQSLLADCKKITSEIEINGLCCSAEHTAPYSISHTLALCLTGDIKYLEQVFRGGHAMLWQILEYLNEEEICTSVEDTWRNKSCEERYSDIDNDYYSKREIQKEKDDWENLTNATEITPEFIKKFRKAANNEGYGMIEFE
jgi:uncharacterized protein YjaG (DUF416 family)